MYIEARVVPHVRVEDAEDPRLTLEGLSVQVRPTVVDESTMPPLNPFTGEMLIVEVALVPAKACMLCGLAATEKSVKLKVAVAEWLMDAPLVPVISRL